jgi:hypothetical protein
MLASTRSPDIRRCALRAARILLLVAGPALFAGCAAQHTAATGASPRPQVVTVPDILEMQSMSTPPAVIYGKIQGSGTVYRLTQEQRDALQPARVPNEIISYMQLTYDHAIQQNPELANSDSKWTEINGYWYGGLPFGWPREWVRGAPAPGDKLR